MSEGSDRRNIAQARSVERLNRSARSASHQFPVAFGRRELKRRANERCGTLLAMGRAMRLPPPPSELTVPDLNAFEILQHERRVSKLDDRLAVFLATMRRTALALEKQIRLGELQGRTGSTPASVRDATALRERLRNIQSTISRLEQYDQGSTTRRQMIRPTASTNK
jgi:hypothetical protein